jgi:CTP:molybdopterin cytidylyltransferase MocA
VSAVLTIVLAAGAGRRMGGSKALLLYREASGPDRPLALAHACCRLDAESSRVVVVTRADVAAVLAPHAPEGALLVVSEAPDELGPAGSLAAATPHLGSEPLVLVTPVDLPPARPALVQRLLSALLDSAARIDAVKPRFAGRGGHPVLVRRSVLTPYERAASALRPPPPLRDVLRSLGVRSIGMDVDDPAALIDWDVSAELGRPAAFFRG